MQIIEDSNIVNWAEYPKYICAMVVKSIEDIVMVSGLTMPLGTEFVWLLDTLPRITRSSIDIIGTHYFCLDGIGVAEGSSHSNIEAIELHLKPKSSVELVKEKQEECLE